MAEPIQVPSGDGVLGEPCWSMLLAAVDLGLSNSKLEGLNSKIRLINPRGYGHHSAAAVIAMIYLRCSGLTITLPTGR